MDFKSNHNGSSPLARVAMFLINYLSVFLFFSLIVALSSIIFILSFVVCESWWREKLSAYECGFNPFEDSRWVWRKVLYCCILFLIFDLEISFLFPFAVSFGSFENVTFYSMLIFLFILTVVCLWMKKGHLTGINFMVQIH